MRTKKAKLIANLCSFAAVITATQFCVVSCSSNSTVQDKPGTEQNPEIKENPNAEEYNVSIKANQGGKLEITINGENETTT